jgi:acetyl esterase/lipase
VVQAGLVLGELEGFLHCPPASGDPHEFRERHRSPDPVWQKTADDPQRHPLRHADACRQTSTAETGPSGAQTPGNKRLVVYITGGGFTLDDKSGNLGQRTYVAEQGYVVASIEYRTVNKVPPTRTRSPT